MPSKSKRASAILSYLLAKRPDEDFIKFCEALQETNQSKIIEKYLNPNYSFRERWRYKRQDTTDSTPGVRVEPRTENWKVLLTEKRIELIDSIDASPDLLLLSWCSKASWIFRMKKSASWESVFVA